MLVQCLCRLLEVRYDRSQHLSLLLKRCSISLSSSGCVLNYSLIELLHFFRSDYSNTCIMIEDVSVSDSPVKTGEVSTVEESYSHNNSKRCSDDEDNNAGHDGIDDDYEKEDDVFEDIEDNEAKSHHLASLLINSHEGNGDDESNLSTDSTRPKSR